MLRHLGTVQAILTTALAAASRGGAVPDADAQVVHRISEAEEAAAKFYGCLSVGQHALLRHTLARCALVRAWLHACQRSARLQLLLSMCAVHCS